MTDVTKDDACSCEKPDPNSKNLYCNLTNGEQNAYVLDFLSLIARKGASYQDVKCICELMRRNAMDSAKMLEAEAMVFGARVIDPIVKPEG